ncbi:uncharacterized protein LOC119186620 isoform X5 [Rhipicephalus microplus]|uniref:uncharacterized protein LOC119186620 isoform X5 n=1 Tax=Rhipicephalus microplus TaxID=6941 RepID=UPI003F6D64B8
MYLMALFTAQIVCRQWAPVDLPEYPAGRIWPRGHQKATLMLSVRRCVHIREVMLCHPWLHCVHERWELTTESYQPKLCTFLGTSKYLKMAATSSWRLPKIKAPLLCRVPPKTHIVGRHKDGVGCHPDTSSDCRCLAGGKKRTNQMERKNLCEEDIRPKPPVGGAC